MQHVSYFEAEAYARWAGGRLPTETEWEKACAWDPAARARRAWPWGSLPPGPDLVNLGGAGLRPAPVGAYPASASAYRAEQMIGDVWEWTSSDFAPWPGKRDPDARLNLLLTDGRRIIATRWNDTLSILRTGGVVVASEPYDDDPGWADVPDHHLVDVADGVVTVTELEA